MYIIFLFVVLSVLSVAFVVGIVGNIGICVVIVRQKYMHTSTNYYLFSLAISDLLIIVSDMFPFLLVIWEAVFNIFDDWYEHFHYVVVQTYLAQFGLCAAICTVTAFTIERYIAICHPLLVYNTADLSKTVKIIVGLWITAFCLAIPKGVLYTFKYFKYTVKSMFLPFGIYLMVIGIVPLICITCCYILIVLELKKENSLIRSGSNRTFNQKKMIKMLVAVVISQFCCWIPLQLVRLYLEYLFIAEPADYAIIKGSWSLNDIAVIVSSLFYFLSTTINPILYNLMSHKFKRAFKDTFLSRKIC